MLSLSTPLDKQIYVHALVYMIRQMAESLTTGIEAPCPMIVLQLTSRALECNCAKRLQELLDLSVSARPASASELAH